MMTVQELIDELELLDPDTPVLTGKWNSSYQCYDNLQYITRPRDRLFVVQVDKDTSGKITYRDTDSGGGVDADNPKVLIL